MMDTRGWIEGASERPLLEQAAPPERACTQLERTSPEPMDGHAASAREERAPLHLHTSLLLFVFGALLVCLSVRAKSDLALSAGTVCLLVATSWHWRTRARLIARFERRALDAGLSPEAARAQGASRADELLASLGRAEAPELLRSAISTQTAPSAQGRVEVARALEPRDEPAELRACANAEGSSR